MDTNWILRVWGLFVSRRCLITTSCQPTLYMRERTWRRLSDLPRMASDIVTITSTPVKAQACRHLSVHEFLVLSEQI